MKVKIINWFSRATELTIAVEINGVRHDNWYDSEMLEPTGNITGNEAPAFLALHLEEAGH